LEGKQQQQQTAPACMPAVSVAGGEAVEEGSRTAEQLEGCGSSRCLP
jgi:hypothetical protein